MIIICKNIFYVIVNYGFDYFSTMNCYFFVVLSHCQHSATIIVSKHSNVSCCVWVPAGGFSAKVLFFDSPFSCGCENFKQIWIISCFVICWHVRTCRVWDRLTGFYVYWVCVHVCVCGALAMFVFITTNELCWPCNNLFEMWSLSFTILNNVGPPFFLSPARLLTNWR